MSAQVADTAGAEAGSELTAQLVDGTAAGLQYIGAPQTTDIPDYAAALAQAQTDAARRPTIDTVTEEANNWLDLGIGLAGILGGTAGTAAIKWLSTARQKANALSEVVQGNEMLKKWLEQSGNKEALEAFYQAMVKTQTKKTEQLVYAERSGAKDSVDLPVTQPTAVN